MTEGIRLQKFLSRAGAASRREAERLMAAGRVTVNGAVVTELGTRVDPGADVVAVDGRAVEVAETRWVLFNKPPGVLTTRADPHGGTTVYDVLPEEVRGLRYVGRLDRDAEGLLLLTNEGDLANRLQHPRTGIEREYRLEVAGRVTRSDASALLRGVELEDGPARAEKVNLLESGDIKSKLTIVITEGRKREVRRMLSAVGHPVMRLRRLRFGPVHLGDLESGRWRELSAAEREELGAAVRSAGRDE